MNKRLDALRSGLEKPLLVSKAANIRYLTGFAGSNAFILVAEDGATFLTDGRYGEIAEGLLKDMADVELVVYTGALGPALAGAIGALPSLTIEKDAITVGEAAAIEEAASCELEPGGGAVEALRRQKDSDEVEALRQAAAAGDAAYARLKDLLADATSEAELAWGLRSAMRTEGAQAAAWEPIVAAGTNASRPHHQTGDDGIGSGLLLLDYGCVVDGYHSDMSRTTWLGSSDPPADLQRLYDAVGEAQEAAIAAVAPGARCRDVDDAARSVLRDRDLAETFLHSTGHGVGLEIHEAPAVSLRSDDVLAAGDVITIEPGAYVPGVGGVRIEDMVLVTDQGPEILTSSPKAFR